MEAGIEREISERVKLNAQRQAREERLVQVGSADANVPLALEMCSSADNGNPEADLASHIVAGAVKDTELLRRTLRNLAFFETFDDDALRCLIEEMEVYEFQPGEKVVRQGDTDGTHFYVVAQGDFYVIKDDSPSRYIGPGSSFGESVLLLHGERSATAWSPGRSRAYGMAGMQVRELLRQQYEQMRRAVVEAMDEVLNSNQCEILRGHLLFVRAAHVDSLHMLRSGLNGFQLQSLYDQVEMKAFKPGDLILQEGDLPDEVQILYSGEVESTSGGLKIGKVPRFYLMGARALLFQDELAFEQPTSLTAATAVETLVLKRILLDTLFGSRLQQVLVRNGVLYVLAQHEDFSRLHQEHREAIASACQIRCLPKGSEASWEDVRVIVAVNGEIQLPHAQHLHCVLLQVSCHNLTLQESRDWQAPLKLQALADSKLAVWRGEDLDSILAFNDFDGALEQDSKVRSLRSVFVFATLSKQQLQRQGLMNLQSCLARALEIQTVKSGDRACSPLQPAVVQSLVDGSTFSKGVFARHFYIIRKGAVSVEIDGRRKRRLGHPDYFGERALLGSEVRSASITALEDTELWKMGEGTFQEIMQGPCLDYLKDRISLQDTALTFKDLEFVRVIGRGGFGIVKMVRAKRTEVRYALKCVRKRDVVEKNMQDALLSELGILKEVDHPFIVKFVRSFRNERSVYFLTELVTGGELLDALDALGLLNHWQALFYTGCMVLALEFLHSRRIAYLDLKSENCLIDQQGYLKLIDFGIAQRITNTRFGPLKGTPVFMAPEMVLGKGNSTVADLWSLGICLYEFVIGQFPFASNCNNRGQIFHQILRAPLRFPEWFYKQPMAEETMGLLRGLLSRDPKRRPGAGHEGYAKMKAHPFFKALCWEKLLCREYEPPYVPTMEIYAEDKHQPVSQSVGESLPTMEEEEAHTFLVQCVDDNFLANSSCDLQGRRLTKAW
ncbi:ATPK2 [Symbiodinium natans]|uniref:cGMP-dependent protein kinase n=1 Tax=Symbiodinium natans TaxID=878477 RepID=A0A812RVI4_9DINO|nr:ATPK2 [Symbiodinium natans]